MIAGAIAAQAILKRVQPRLIVDGKYGNYTHSVYLSADNTTKGEVDRVLAEMGTTVAKLSAGFAASVTAKGVANSASDAGSWIPATDVYAYVRRFAEMFGAANLTTHIQGFLDIEARKKTVNGVALYDAKSVSPNGNYMGLFQMGRAAWSDSQKLIKNLGVGFELQPFQSGWSDPKQNAAAGVAYAIINAKALTLRRIPVTASTLYAAHNQGAAGFASYVAKGTLLAPKQSQLALRVLATARNETIMVA